MAALLRLMCINCCCWPGALVPTIVATITASSARTALACFAALYRTHITQVIKLNVEHLALAVSNLLLQEATAGEQGSRQGSDAPSAALLCCLQWALSSILLCPCVLLAVGAELTFAVQNRWACPCLTCVAAQSGPSTACWPLRQ